MGPAQTDASASLGSRRTWRRRVRTAAMLLEQGSGSGLVALFGVRHERILVSAKGAFSEAIAMSRTNVDGVAGALHRNGADRERGPAGPLERALSAMAEASRRAREGSEPTSVTPSYSEPTLVPGAFEAEPTLVLQAPIPEPTLVYPPVTESSLRTEKARFDEVPRRRPGTQTPIVLAIVAIGAVVVALGAVVIVLNTSSRTHSSTPPPTAAGVAPGHPSISSGEGSPGISTRSGSTTTAPTTTAPRTPVAGSVPEITALTPSSGAVGQSVVISGTGLFSSDGHVQAFFGGKQAPTSCPSQSSCTVMVPVLSGPARPVPFTVTTEMGTSNTMSFYYG